MIAKVFHEPLGDSKDDVLHIRLEFKETHRLVKFSLNYTTIIKEGEKEARKAVVRYDSIHGFAHMHRFYRSPPTSEQINEPVSLSTVQKLTLEVRQNWKSWKKAFFENHGRF